jgi:energy-coupling factor transporter ATP-binding protein EcfA2
LIRIEKLVYAYPRSDELALRGIDLNVDRGEFFVIMGHAGAGKTTLCLTTNGIIPHYLEGKIDGKISIAGFDALATPIEKLVTKVGVVFQDPESQIFGVTVEEDVSFGPCNFNLSLDDVKQRVKDALTVTRLSGYEKRETAQLSGGEKQRVTVAGVLAIGPEVLVLDEATSELDPVGRNELISVVAKLKQAGNTIVMVELGGEDIAPYADRVAIMKNGKIAAEGKPQQVFSKIEDLKALGVRPPAICELFVRLRREGILTEDRPVPLSLEEASARLAPVLKDRSPPKRTLGVEPRDIVKNDVVICAKDLEHIYAGGLEAVRGVNLEIMRGDFVALIGRNGSGKTTLVKHFNGLLRPTNGSVLVNGEDASKKTVTELSKVVGYVFQNPDHQIFTPSVREEIAYGLKNMGLDEKEIETRVHRILKVVRLEGREETFPFNLGKGERQNLAVGSVLAMEPEVLIVDEPTTGLDMEGIDHIMALMEELHRNGHTVLIITHDMGVVAKYARRVVALQEGKILLDGPPREVFSKPDILEKSSLRPPQITRLAQSLGRFGVPNDILSVDEFCAFLKGE